MPAIFHRKPQRRALLIGISYQDASQAGGWPRLNSTHKDVKAFRALLRHTYGYTHDEITVMKDHKSVPRHLWPTAENIRRELDRLVCDAADDDQLVLLFCGHSDQLDPQETKDKMEEDRQDEFIIACDAQRIVDNELYRRLVAPIENSNVNLTAIFDACHSGTLLDLPHHHCNQIYVPWLSTTRRRTRTLQYPIARRLTLPPAPLPFALPDSEPAPAPAPASTVLSLVLSVNTCIPSPKAPLVGSPAALYACTGLCTRDARPRGAAVVSLSSCADPQRSWESNAGSMTTMLCKYLEKHAADAPAPSYRAVLTHINYTLHADTLELHAWTRAEKKAAHAVEGEMRSFQMPELGSLVPLDMDAPFRLGL